MHKKKSPLITDELVATIQRVPLQAQAWASRVRVSPQHFSSVLNKKAGLTPKLYRSILEVVAEFRGREPANVRQGPPIATTKIPLLAEVPLGELNMVGDEVLDWLLYAGEKTSGIYALRGIGNSMSPKIEDGDIIFVDAQMRPTNGKIVPYRIDFLGGPAGEEIGCKVFHEFQDRIEFHWLNPPEKKMVIYKRGGNRLELNGIEVELHMKGVAFKIERGL